MKGLSSENEYYDALIVGAGVSGLNCALHLPASLRVLVICKGGLRESDSFLAQGGICVLHDKGDYKSYFEDTMRAGHYENDPAAVRCMIENSRATIDYLSSVGVRFARGADGELLYTREGAHSRPRICFHEDCTGKEITSHLLSRALAPQNIEIRSYTTMLDLICGDGDCFGAVVRDNRSGALCRVFAKNTVLATGGIGGLYAHSTNYRILTGDGLAVSLRHGVAVDHADYVQIHPTVLYSKRRGRRFLISESVRGEGAVLLDGKGERFVDELLPRDAVTAAIRKKMREEGSEYVRLDMRKAGDPAALLQRFPGIVKRCKEEGYDLLKEPVPVVPAQHYFMGGIRSGLCGRTTMEHLYAVGETCCNGVHGKNRLASNSLLEALIFAERAAADIAERGGEFREKEVDLSAYTDYRALQRNYKKEVTEEINRER